MNTSKKFIICSIIVMLLLCSVFNVFAAPTTLQHQYVGDNFCNEVAVLKIFKLVGYIIIIAKIAIPLILIVLGALDLYKGVIGKDEKDLFAALKTFVLRIFAGVVVFFIPTIIDVAFDVIFENSGGTVSNKCVSCVLDVNQC